MAQVVFQGFAGRLEGDYVQSRDVHAPVALILSPHPQRGGNFKSPEVLLLRNAFSRVGFSTFSFNFRGVGHSEGICSKGEGELSDAASAMDWIQTTYAEACAFWMGGFCFGAWVGLQLLVRRPEIKGFVVGNLPVDTHDFGFLTPCPTSGLVLHGRNASVSSTRSVNMIVEKMMSQKHLRIQYDIVDGASNMLLEQSDYIEVIIQGYLKSQSAARRIVA